VHACIHMYGYVHTQHTHTTHTHTHTHTQSYTSSYIRICILWLCNHVPCNKILMLKLEIFKHFKNNLKIIMYLNNIQFHAQWSFQFNVYIISM